MKIARVLISFIAVFGVVITSCRGQWRPQYSPYATTVLVKNTTFSVTLKYNQWQGYFANVFTLPAGHPLDSLRASLHTRCQVSRTSLQFVIYPMWPKRLATRAAVRAGTGALDAGRNVTWHIGSNLTFNIAPATAMDVDRVGERERQSRLPGSDNKINIHMAVRSAKASCAFVTHTHCFQGEGQCSKPVGGVQL